MSVSFDPKSIKFGTVSSSSLLTGLIAYWKLNETSGNVASEVGTFPGTATGGTPTYDASGKLDRCLTFAGAEYMSMGTTSSLKPTSAFSVSAWFKTSGSGYKCIVSNYVYDVDVWGWGITTEATKIRAAIGNGTSSVVADGVTTVTGGAWFHAVITFDGSYLRLYINGTQDGSFPYAVPIGYIAGSDFEVGGRDGGAAPLTGSVDEVGYWNRALTTGEITSLYNSGTGITHPF
jgi:hypothetical protein